MQPRNSPPRCVCTNDKHGHGERCDHEATETDGLCKECHDKALEEFAAEQPLIPPDVASS
jgi:hypothetical protein